MKITSIDHVGSRVSFSLFEQHLTAEGMSDESTQRPLGDRSKHGREKQIGCLRK